MFSRWGSLVHRSRFTVIGVMVAFLLGLAAYGASLSDHLSQSGWDDPGSEAVYAARTADAAFGRDRTGDVVALYTAPEGSTVDDPAFADTVATAQEQMLAEHPDQIAAINLSYFQQPLPALTTPDRTTAIATFAIVGDDDTEITNNFREVRDAFQIEGVDVQLAGLQPIANALNDTMAGDIKRMEILAIPVVGVLLFFVFGGLVAAALPLIIGGLTVVAANGLVRLFTNVVEVNSFVAPVVSLIGLGLAIDYALFIVSRFREELGDGRTTQQAVQRSVMTAGRTVVFSATMIVASLGGLLLFPQGFLKSVAFGAIATVVLAALTSITILPAMLSILGRRVDAFGLKRMRTTKSSEEIENGPWGKLTRWVMRNPLKSSVPIILGLLILTLPVGAIQFGGINETYLPPDNPTRVAQAEFDANFPTYRTEPLKIVIEDAEGPQLGAILREASTAPGLVEPFSIDRNEGGIAVLSAGLQDRNVSEPAIESIRSIDVPDGVTMSVGGTPAIEQDSIAALVDRLPLMAALVVLVTTVLMFLTFGSLVIPIKAVLMTMLGLGATLGILTFIFVAGNGAGLLNFTPGPIMAPVLVLIIAIIYGLSTDYEVFLLSRMVEARERGASTSEAIRIGTSHTGRIITAAALILIVVTGAFAFSELVMMKYIAYGMIAALIIDATLIRMFLVPSIMKMLGDDCWWAPQWMKRAQEKLGLGEPLLDADLMPAHVPEVQPIGAAPLPPRTRDPLTLPIPRVTAGTATAATRSGPRASEPRISEPRVSEPPVSQPPVSQPPVSPPPVSQPPVSQPPVSEPAESEPSSPETGSPRPIESWLAELRSPAKNTARDARAGDASTSKDSRTADAGTSRSYSYGSVGHDGIDSRPSRRDADALLPRANGSKANGNGNGNGSNGNGSNGNGNGSNGGGSNGNGSAIDPWIASLRMPSRDTDAPTDDAGAESGRTETSRPDTARPRPTPRPNWWLDDVVPDRADSDSDAPVDPPRSAPDSDRAAQDADSADASESTESETRSERRARTESNGSGRHHGQSGAISVSELLARQRRQ